MAVILERTGHFDSKTFHLCNCIDINGHCLMKITVLGSGMVGSAIIQDLARDSRLHVTAVDASQKALDKFNGNPNIHVVRADLREAGSVADAVAECDLAVNAVPGFMGFSVLRQIIEAGKNVVDISFFPENALELDTLAKSRNVTAVVDCGVAPGLCNIIAGHVTSLQDKTDTYACYVGGLPQVREWPYEYKAVFSPSDVLEEYTRPARFVENGEEVVWPPLSGVELMDFPEIGTLEAFNTDGLRTLLRTMNIPDMCEKTLRYPGHANLMRIFRESGFFDTHPVDVKGEDVVPMDLTSRLLFDKWRLGENEVDFTVMRVVLEGRTGNHRQRYTYDLYDQYDITSKTTSMARTTGYTCTIVARQILGGIYTETGISPPEYLGAVETCWENLLQEYAKRKIRLNECVAELENHP